VGNHIVTPQEHGIGWVSDHGHVANNLVYQPTYAGFWTEETYQPIMGLVMSDNMFLRTNAGWAAIVLFGTNDAFVVDNDLNGSFGSNVYGTGANRLWVTRNASNLGINIDGAQRSLHVPDVRIEPGAVLEGEEKGDAYVNASSGKLNVYDGSNWRDLD
jgi:hypothetical protein